MSRYEDLMRAVEEEGKGGRPVRPQGGRIKPRAKGLLRDALEDAAPKMAALWKAADFDMSGYEWDSLSDATQQHFARFCTAVESLRDLFGDAS